MCIVDPEFIEKTTALRNLPTDTPNYRNVIIGMVLRELRGNTLFGYFYPCLQVAEELLGANLYIEDDGTFSVLEDKEQWTWEYVDTLIAHLRHNFSKELIDHAGQAQKYARRHFPSFVVLQQHLEKES